MDGRYFVLMSLLTAIFVGVVKAVAITALLAWLLPTLIAFSFKSCLIIFLILFAASFKLHVKES